MARLALVILFATLVAGCGVHVRAGVPAPVPPPPPPVVHVPSSPPPVARRAAPRSELRAKDLEANYVRARVIYAKEVKAAGGRIGRIQEWHDRGRGRGRGGNPGYSWGSRDVSAPEVQADVIYVKELRARFIEADVIVAKDVDIGRYR
jgi:hypothetical protein